MIAVEVKNLGKAYKLYQSPTQRIKEIVLRRPFHTEFVALNNINFSLLKGETFGIIGENGAGKSTLLKILAKTLQPTSGSVAISGRTAALLELGAGFNPELTGEENIYLNAYLLGLSKAEIDAKKQEIIDFSELGDFIKRPVKTYSSGMHVRLAFSIATSVNPDVLIIDEALSVGDEYFQKKCTDRMMNFKKAEKTILFCSHSMYHVQELCSRAIWLHKGEIQNIGDTGKVILEYQNYERSKTAVLREQINSIVSEGGEPAGKPVRIIDAKVKDKDGNITDSLKTLEPAVFSFKTFCGIENIKGHLGFAIIRNDELMCFGTTTGFDGLQPVLFKGEQEFSVRIERLSLLAGIYSLLVVVADEHAMHPYETLRTGPFVVNTEKKELGLTYIEHTWVI